MRSDVLRIDIPLFSSNCSDSCQISTHKSDPFALIDAVPFFVRHNVQLVRVGGQRLDQTRKAHGESSQLRPSDRSLHLQLRVARKLQSSYVLDHLVSPEFESSHVFQHVFSPRNHSMWKADPK